jgi:hypothetical protein
MARSEETLPAKTVGACSIGPHQEAELKDLYQGAKARKDLDMGLRIHGLLLVHRGNREIMAADMIG